MRGESSSREHNISPVAYDKALSNYPYAHLAAVVMDPTGFLANLYHSTSDWLPAICVVYT